MRFLAILACGAASVAAQGVLGFNLGTKLKGGVCKYADDYVNDFDHLRPTTKLIRVYSTSDCETLKWLMPALEKAQDFKVFIGLWPDDPEKFELEIEALQEFVNQENVKFIEGFIVGSEALYRKSLTAENVVKNIKRIKDEVLPGMKLGVELPVGYADTWNLWIQDLAKPVIEACDIAFFNAFSYWQGQTRENMTASFFDDVFQAKAVIESVRGVDFPCYIGETGWAAGGGKPFEAAEPTVEVASQFWQEAICGMRAWGFPMLIFQAFDDDSKEVEKENEVERHWGVFYQEGNREAKYDLECKYGKSS